jgi:hypothetical protein
VAHAQTGAQWQALGCQLATASLTLPFEDGGIPMWTLGYRSAFFARNAETTPNTGITEEECHAAPLTGGSVFLQAFGTATRQLVKVGRMTLTMSWDIINLPMSSSANLTTYQLVGGYEIGPFSATLSMDIPRDNDWDDTSFTNDGPDASYYHCLVTCNPTHKRAFGFYAPKIEMISPTPTVTDFNGARYQTLTFRLHENGAAATDKSKSLIRFFAG